MFECSSWMAPLVALMPLVVCLGLLLVVILCERFVWFAQLMKYGAIGVVSTYIQMIVFYTLAITCLPCLGSDDVAVRFLHFAPSDVSDGVRAIRFAFATGAGFTIANIACWLMNRWCVFHAGKFRWYIEFGLFFGAALFATIIALALSAALIRWAALMTTFAVVLEIVVSFFINFFARKFFIFKG